MRWPESSGWTVTDSPAGPVLLVAGPLGLERLELGVDPAISGPSSSGRCVRADADLSPLVAMVHDFFDGSDELSDVRVAPIGSDFAQEVRGELRRVPRGVTVSYGELARRVGRPRSSRAVGRAVATNPTALAVPCHRVVRSDGALGGFAYGVGCKRMLLELEGAA